MVSITFRFLLLYFKLKKKTDALSCVSVFYRAFKRIYVVTSDALRSYIHHPADNKDNSGMNLS